MQRPREEAAISDQPPIKKRAQEEDVDSSFMDDDSQEEDLQNWYCYEKDTNKSCMHDDHSDVFEDKGWDLIDKGYYSYDECMQDCGTDMMFVPNNDLMRLGRLLKFGQLNQPEKQKYEAGKKFDDLIAKLDQITLEEKTKKQKQLLEEKKIAFKKDFVASLRQQRNLVMPECRIKIMENLVFPSIAVTTNDLAGRQIKIHQELFAKIDLPAIFKLDSPKGSQYVIAVEPHNDAKQILYLSNDMYAELGTDTPIVKPCTITTFSQPKHIEFVIFHQSDKSVQQLKDQKAKIEQNLNGLPFIAVGSHLKIGEHKLYISKILDTQQQSVSVARIPAGQVVDLSFEIENKTI